MVSSLRFPSCVEILEGRIAPAAVFSYTDADGHLVTITTSKGAVDALDTLVELDDLGGGKFTLLSLDLTDPLFKGTSLTINVTDQAGTDVGNTLHTSVGFINATGIDLGKVTIDGDLNKIIAGDALSSTAGISSLTVESWGQTDVTAGSQAGEFDSVVTGAITTLTVVGDFEGAYLRVKGSDSDRTDGLPKTTNSHGKIGTLLVGGSVLGTARDNGGSIVTTGDIGKVTVTGSVQGFIDVTPPATPITSANENAQKQNGRVFAGGKMGTVTIGVDIVGGDGFESGQVASAFGMSTVNIAGDILGGYGEDSGALGAGGTLGKVTIVGSLDGGHGTRSGAILSSSSMLAVNIGGNINGGEGDQSGFLAAAGTLQSVTIGGTLFGGAGDESGSLGAFGNVGAVSIGLHVLGGTGDYSGQILSGSTIKSVTIGGDFAGGGGYESGAIGSLRGIGPVLIKGDMFAGTGDRSGIVTTEGSPITAAPSVGFNAAITSVTINGSLYGTGRDANGDLDPTLEGGDSAASIISGGTLGAVVVGGSVEGGENGYTASIRAASDIKSVTIGDNLKGGVGSYSGTIVGGGKIGTITLGGSGRDGHLIGGAGYFSGSIHSELDLAKVVIWGSILAGNGQYSANIEAYHSESESEAGLGSEDIVANIGSVFVAQSILGSTGNSGSIGAAAIYSEGKIGSIVIGDPNDGDTETGNLQGGLARGSGSIVSGGDLGPVKIESSIIGGSGDESGKINSGGKIASLTLGGSLQGGGGNYDTTVEFGDELGQVYARGAIGDVVIKGSISGNDGNYSGTIRGLSIKSVKALGLSGGDGVGSGSLVAYSLDIGTVDITYSISSGAGARSGWVSAYGSINSVKAGYILGDSTTRVHISAGHSLKSVTVAEDIEYTDLLAGYAPGGTPFNPDAQIGSITIGTGTGTGNMTATNIVAGAQTGDPDGIDDGVFGTLDDHSIKGLLNVPNTIAKIASVIIKGTVISTPAFGDQYGIVAEQISVLKIGGVSASGLTPGARNDGPTPVITGSDTTFFEVGNVPH